MDPRGFDVTIPAAHGAPAAPAFAVLPDGATRGVVVIHEIFGRQPEIDRVALRFARHGYAAVAPDLFASRHKVACIRSAMRALASGAGPEIEQLRAARAWLGERAGVATERVGVIGFCIGGGFALAVGRGWGAVSANYGDVPPADVLRGIGPVVACYGGRDVLFRKNADVLRERLGAVGVSPEVHTYPEVGHSFLTDGDHPIARTLTWPFMHVDYNPAVAEDAWSTILAFFDLHLG